MPRTAIVSDLHLGTAKGTAVLGSPKARERLVAAIAGVDRLVLLGDTVELRERPVAEALALARPVVAELAAAVAEDGEVVLVPGNHDHQLGAPLLETRRLRSATKPLGLEERARPGRTGLLASLLRQVKDREVALAYPGVWVREDVYATHGHYLDLLVTVPTFETLSVAAVRRALGTSEGDLRTPDGFEAALGPAYAFSYQLAQGLQPAKARFVPGTSSHVWRRLNGSNGRAQALVLGGALTGAVALLNRLGLGPFSPDLRVETLRRSALEAMRRTVDLLGIEARHVIFGHTHRRGPLARDKGDPDWTTAAGAQLLNAGSWIHEPAFVGSSPKPDNPYFPGSVVFVEEDGPPELRPLLADLEAHALTAPGV